MPHTIKSRAPFILGTDSRTGFADDEALSSLRVLIADPYPQLREIMRDILLRGIGVEEVIEAKSGEEVLALLSKLSCDVAIIDCAMTPLGGIELTQRIRKGVEGIDPFLPVILVSGRADVAEIVTARDVGANEYLAKPLSAKILDLRLNSVIKRPRPFVRVDNFFGPDRRRHAKYGFDGSERRTHEANVIDPNK